MLQLLFASNVILGSNRPNDKRLAFLDSDISSDLWSAHNCVNVTALYCAEVLLICRTPTGRPDGRDIARGAILLGIESAPLSEDDGDDLMNIQVQ